MFAYGGDEGEDRYDVGEEKDVAAEAAVEAYDVADVVVGGDEGYGGEDGEDGEAYNEGEVEAEVEEAEQWYYKEDIVDENEGGVYGEERPLTTRRKTGTT